jgi:hypothetical protein
VDGLFATAKFSNILRPGDVFEGIPCQKLAIDISWFKDWRLYHWLPVPAARMYLPFGRKLLAMISHCKELREIGVVLDNWLEGRERTLDGRNTIRRRWEASEELQGQKMPKLRVWDVEGKKVKRLDRK